MKTAIQAAECINTGCKPVTLRYPLEADETVAFFHGGSELTQGQLLASPLMEYFNEEGAKVMQRVEWMKIVGLEVDHDGVARRMTVLRGHNYSTALKWPKDTVFHALPLTGPQS